MRYAVRHRTCYRYAHPVAFARCNLRLRPIDGWGQSVEAFGLEINPPTRVTPARASGYPVHVARAVVERAARALTIESRSEVTVARETPVTRDDDPTLEAIARAALAERDLSPEAPAGYLFPSPLIPLDAEITDWCAAALSGQGGIVAAGLALAQAIRSGFRYDGGATGPSTRPAEAFAKRAGVCQDFAQVMIAGARGLGLPAAYVSGYLRTDPPPGAPRLIGADASHAWTMLWCGPARGWIGFDPTNGCLVGQDHVITAIGRDYADVAPIDGVFTGQDGQQVEVSVDVEAIG